MSDGNKHDHDKARMDLIDPHFEESLGYVLGDGAKRYGEYNWRKVEPERYVAAMHRHLLAIKKGVVFDESGQQHTAHIAANAMFLHYFLRTTNETSNV
jgi:hypothetical protein